ncbi:hypothetical protein M9H77_15104 [Catharanthus roseus]|uniref:Uncharacterized protein n=1 Tax=Catharanthus roseus TaxID=4058 RepID=A0ACC0BQ06_CATRO|nr:hypothetical protein M9H77_15104 [Catharanthus roseus]
MTNVMLRWHDRCTLLPDEVFITESAYTNIRTHRRRLFLCVFPQPQSLSLFGPPTKQNKYRNLLCYYYHSSPPPSSSFLVLLRYRVVGFRILIELQARKL